MIGHVSSLEEYYQKLENLRTEIGGLKFQRLMLNLCYGCGIATCMCEEEKLFQVNKC